MIDKVKIYVKAGRGGDGCCSFKGSKHSRRRHPDGGGGGQGADVIIKVDRGLQGLESFQFKAHFQAEDGGRGQANKRRGADGRPCIIKVPRGTIVRDLKNNLLLGDLNESDQELVVARGGAGGRGNARTKEATKGESGEERYLSLELKLMAEVGIVGCPNAGKSTFLARVTSSRPRIASYPFTTKVPCLGVLEFADFTQPASLTLIELPALVKDAHQGKGLGVEFLRHAERVKILIHLIDMAAQEEHDPLQDYYDLNAELKLYSTHLAKIPQVLVANKMDLPPAQSNLTRFTAKIKQPIFPISALTGAGLDRLLKYIRGFLQKELDQR